MSKPEEGWFQAFHDALEQLERTTLALLCLGLVIFSLLLALNIEIGIEQGDWSTAWLLWLLMLGASRAMATDEHPRLILFRRFSARIQVWLTRLMFALGSLVCLMLSMATLGLVALEIRFEGEWAAGLPSWQVLLVMPLALAMLTARLAAMTLAPEAWLAKDAPMQQQGR